MDTPKARAQHTVSQRPKKKRRIWGEVIKVDCNPSQVVFTQYNAESPEILFIDEQVVTDPLILFLYLFDNSIDYLLEHTQVKHANQCAELIRAGSTRVQYNEISRDELLVKIGIDLIIDVYPLNQLEFYWGRRGSLVKIDCIASAMPCIRYSEIRNVVSVVDKNKMSQLLSDKVNSLVPVSRHLVVDEQLRRFFGRSSTAVVNPKKPAKRGQNSYVLADGVCKVH